MTMIFIKKANILQILLLLLVLSGCKEKKKPTTDPIEIIKEKITEEVKAEPKLTEEYIAAKTKSIDHFYQKNWPNNSLNGEFLVAKNGQIIYEKYNGYADYKAKTPMTSSTPLHIASVSKVITATAILKLISANKLQLDQKVSTILKEFPYPNVTVKHLLNHRSGIRSYAYFTDKRGLWDKHKMLSNQDVLTLLATKGLDLEYKTNTRFAYCNTNYAMLALIIEKLTGKAYKDAMQDLIFKPLDMKDSFVFDYEKDKLKATPSYRGNFSKFNLDFLDAIYGDKNIFSTARDLLKFDIGRNSPSFLDPKLLEEAYTPYSNEHPGKKNYGLGMRMINWPTGQNFYFHNGWWHGSTSSYVTLPEEKVTIIAISNKFSRMPYRVRKLSVLFGDYPFKLDDDEKEE
ncbi:beta-lactamase family protein [Flavobacterium sp. F-392]|uniref:Beta-lactamase family protein n=2 Tax=Flavobacterium muglaense TaxID=2764716 RepID=A0A923MZH7_9FLAO|nr:serine hydrolase domain-containing protein [Flavobacterium muglaense]MBC5837751.1 beta-lactamase family protein [Flavobacterium muglaense]MBC5844277.1 beta-lactamase family protein [Flavobacterium muglaense]